MKTVFNLLVVTALTTTVLLSSCKKKEDDISKEEETSIEALALSNSEDLTLKSASGTYTKYEKVIVNPLVESDDCKFIVSGTIEYRLDDVTVATVDYGNGNCDNIATKTVDGVTTEFELDYKGYKDKWKKVIAEPLVKIEGCEYISSGLLKYYDVKDDMWVASFDYGDGTCDDLIKKITKDGVSEFSMNDYPEYNK